MNTAPVHLVKGRLYEEHILDMYEFGVADGFKSIDDFKGQKKGRGAKPVMVFLGDQWQNDAVYGHIQNMLLDFFRGDKVLLA
jgi:ribosome production factor 2